MMKTRRLVIYSTISVLIFHFLIPEVEKSMALHSNVKLIISLFFLPFILLVPFSNASVQPLVIAAHPQEANQFALGLSDGGVHVFEPLESEGKWGVAPPVENGSASSVPTTPSVGASGSDQAPRWSSS